MLHSRTEVTALPMGRIIRTWWPLAASWLLMSVELPAIAAVIARLADPEIHLAAYGSVTFPLALIIESPIIMLLAASTALSKDWTSYMKLRRFMSMCRASSKSVEISDPRIAGISGVSGLNEWRWNAVKSHKPGFMLTQQAPNGPSGRLDQTLSRT